jgi:hypothetical protein
MDGPYFCLRTCCCGFVASGCSHEAVASAFVDHLSFTFLDEQRIHTLVSAVSGPAKVAKAAPVEWPSDE